MLCPCPFAPGHILNHIILCDLSLLIDIIYIYIYLDPFSPTLLPHDFPPLLTRSLLEKEESGLSLVTLIDLCRKVWIVLDSSILEGSFLYIVLRKI